MNQAKRLPGQKMTISERQELIGCLVDELTTGMYSDRELSRKLNVGRSQIVKYKPYALKLIATTKIDRPSIRVLQIQRVYNRIEQLNNEFQPNQSIKDKMSIHNQLTKLEQHLAMIAGLNIETQININQKQLVITRANPKDVRKVTKSIENTSTMIK